jgi:SAM-dependent methyltransferase
MHSVMDKSHRLMSSELYSKAFYERLRDGATRSAEVMAPLVLQLVPARSVVDVGCGDGSWLAVFRKLGVDDVLGIDGGHVDRSLLQIPQERFRALDLTKPIALGRTFDLAISLEVAEHLPPDSASVFVEGLTRLAPAVLFSAAIPFQGGDHHVNEQWPDKWADHFKQYDFLPVDFIRKRVWKNDAVERWYAQNALLFANANLIENNAALKGEFERTTLDQLCLVHPRQYLYLQDCYREAAARGEQPRQPSGVREASRFMLVCLRNALKKRIDSIFRKEARP